MKRSVFACVLVVVCTLAVSVTSQAEAASISVSDIVQTVTVKPKFKIVPDAKVVGDGEEMQVVYQGGDIYRWRIRFDCPKGTAVYLDDENLCKITKVFGKSKANAFALDLRFENDTSSTKNIKLHLNATDINGKQKKTQTTVKVEE